MNSEHFIYIAIVILAASTLQGIVGFGFSLFAIPIFLLLGISLPQSVAICLLASTIQRAMAVSHLRNAIDWPSLIPMILISLCTLPIGFFMMYKLTSLDRNTVSQIVGVLILAAVLLRWLIKTSPHKTIARKWGYLAAGCSGIFNGLANIGGPPIVMWILMHDWPNEKMRVTTLAFTLASVPFQLLILIWIFGLSVLPAPIDLLIIVPAVLAGTQLGLKIGAKVAGSHIRIIAQVLLLIIALTSILKPFIGSP